MSPKAVSRLHTLTWALVYGGLFAVTTGFATGDADLAGWLWGVGGAAVAVGLLLIVLRARMGD